MQTLTTTIVRFLLQSPSSFESLFLISFILMKGRFSKYFINRWLDAQVVIKFPLIILKFARAQQGSRCLWEGNAMRLTCQLTDAVVHDFMHNYATEYKRWFTCFYLHFCFVHQILVINKIAFQALSLAVVASLLGSRPTKVTIIKILPSQSFLSFQNENFTGIARVRLIGEVWNSAHGSR